MPRKPARSNKLMHDATAMPAMNPAFGPRAADVPAAVVVDVGVGGGCDVAKLSDIVIVLIDWSKDVVEGLRSQSSLLHRISNAGTDNGVPEESETAYL